MELDLDHRKALILIAVFVVVNLVRIFLTWENPPLWDSAIYAAMAKHLYTLGEIGLWEVFRPPLLPLIAGFFWFLGLPAMAVMKLVPLMLSTVTLSAIYLSVDSLLDRKSALITLGLVSMSYMYLYYSSMLLTGIAASGLIFLSFYFLKGRKLLTAGFLTGLGFLIRFPAGIVLPAGFTYIMVREGFENYRETFKQMAGYFTGFFLTVAPYLLANYYYLSNPLKPFIEAVVVPSSQNPDKYLYGIYYLLEIFKTNPLLVGAIPGVYLVLKNRQEKYYGFLIGLVFFYGFFALFSHKEPRYALLFLPLVALFASRFFRDIDIQNLLPVERNALNITNLLVVLSILGILLSGYYSYDLDSRSSADRVDFYRFNSQLDGDIASNDGTILAYSDITYRALVPGRLSEVYNQTAGDVDYYSVNSCAWYCPGEKSECRAERDSLRQNLQTHKKVFEREDARCNYTVYRGDKD